MRIAYKLIMISFPGSIATYKFLIMIYIFASLNKNKTWASNKWHWQHIVCSVLDILYLLLDVLLLADVFENFRGNYLRWYDFDPLKLKGKPNLKSNFTVNLSNSYNDFRGIRQMRGYVLLLSIYTHILFRFILFWKSILITK